MCSKFYVPYFNIHFAEIRANFLNGPIQNKSQFYSDSFYRTALYFKTVSRQKLPVTNRVFILWQTVSKFSVFYCRLVFREFHSRIQMHCTSIVKFGITYESRSIFIVRSSVFELNITICITFMCIYIYLFLFIYLFIYVVSNAHFKLGSTQKKIV